MGIGCCCPKHNAYVSGGPHGTGEEGKCLYLLVLKQITTLHFPRRNVHGYKHPQFLQMSCVMTSPDVMMAACHHDALQLSEQSAVQGLTSEPGAFVGFWHFATYCSF